MNIGLTPAEAEELRLRASETGLTRILTLASHGPSFALVGFPISPSLFPLKVFRMGRASRFSHRMCGISRTGQYI